MRILVVEDDAQLRENLKSRLTEEGFIVAVAGDGEEGLFAAIEHSLDAAIVDLGLPKLPGLDVVRQVRAKQRTFPILVLTARAGWRDMVEVLEAGADDYVKKPFHFREVLARLRTLVRRSSGWVTSVLTCGPVVVDTHTQTVLANGKPVELTTFEYRVLEHLMLHVGRIISKTELSQRLYDEDRGPESNVIDCLIARVRRKLDPEDRIKPIETVRGRGYRFSLERTAPPNGESSG